MTTLKVGVREAQALRVKFGEPVFVRALLGSGVPHDQHPPFKSNQLALTVMSAFRTTKDILLVPHRYNYLDTLLPFSPFIGYEMY